MNQESISDELEAATQRLDDLREQVREDLGGNPEDYNADTYHAAKPVADGGE